MFNERLEAGADCPELYEIRNAMDPKSRHQDAMNQDLRRIGCGFSGNVRGVSPTQAPTDTPCPSAAEAAYLQPLGESMTVIGNQTLPALGEMFSQASAAPDLVAVLESPEWQAGVGEVLYAISAHADAIEALNPPVSGIVIQSEALEMTAVLWRILELTGQFIDGQDWTALDQIGSLSAEMNAIGNRILPMILDFCEG